MEYTTNLKLKKPGYTDPVDIKDINDNFDIIDKLGESSANGDAPVQSVNGKTGAVTLTAADVGADVAGAAASVTKSQIGLGNVDDVKQYSASNPPPYPVTSVNGQTGAVKVSGVTKTVLWSGSATPGSVGTAQIDLSGTFAEYNWFEVAGSLNAGSSYPFVVLGVYSPSGYDGAGINALGTFYSTGGFYYHLALYISDSGVYRSFMNYLNSSSSSSNSLTLTKITGYKLG